MRCEDGRERLSRLVDGELGADEQAGLFGHLEACGECRGFLETLVHVRGAVRRDREAGLREADESLPPWPPRPEGAVRAGGRERPAPSWRGLPAPAALALAAVLLVAGIGIGAGLARRDAARSAREAEARRPAPEPTRVVYVCAMPECEVVGEPVPQPGR